MSELLLRGGYVLSMDAAIGDLPAGDVRISGDRIVAIGEHLNAGSAEVIDATSCIIAPGFIDGHRHAWLSLLRGAASNQSLPEYMVEARAMYCGCFDSEAAYIANYIGGLESLDAGITSIVDHSHLQKSPEVSDALVRGLLDSGIGGFFCYALQNVPDFLSDAAVDERHVSELLTRPADDWHYANAARIRDTYFEDSTRSLKFGVAMFEGTAYIPHEMSRGLFERAQTLRPALITSHWDAIAKPGFYLSSLGALQRSCTFSFPTLLAHGNHLNDEDLQLMAASRIALCTCPDTECGMGLGPLLAYRFAAIGGAASLGLDLTSYVKADMLRQAHLSLQVERHSVAERTGAMPGSIASGARSAVELLTIAGSRAIGLQEEVGSLVPGKRADLLMIERSAEFAARAVDPYVSLIFYSDNSDIRTVIASGKVRKRDGRLEGVDTAALKARAGNALDRVRSRYQQLQRAKFVRAWASMF